MLGCLFLLLYGGVRVWQEHARVQGIASYRHVYGQPADRGLALTPRLFQPARPDQTLWSKQRVMAFTASARIPSVPQGLLRIPSLGLEVPIYPRATELALNQGAAHIEGTAALAERMGNIGIAAHRDGFFRKLKDLELHQEIDLEIDGRLFRYRVVGLSIVPPSEVNVLSSTKVPSITLVTCYPFYFVGAAPLRYIVRGEIDASESSPLNGALDARLQKLFKLAG